MIQLAADVSDRLLELTRGDQAPIDAVEVGPWFSVGQVRRYRQRLARLRFHFFHGGDLVRRMGIIQHLGVRRPLGPAFAAPLRARAVRARPRRPLRWVPLGAATRLQAIFLTCGSVGCMMCVQLWGA